MQERERSGWQREDDDDNDFDQYNNFDEDYVDHYDDEYDDDDGDDKDNARQGDLAGKGKGLRLPSIIPTIQPLSVFLAKGNFIPRDFYENVLSAHFNLGIILLFTIIPTIQPLVSSWQKKTSHQRMLLKKDIILNCTLNAILQCFIILVISGPD